MQTVTTKKRKEIHQKSSTERIDERKNGNRQQKQQTQTATTKKRKEIHQKSRTERIDERKNGNRQQETTNTDSDDKEKEQNTWEIKD